MSTYSNNYSEGVKSFVSISKIDSALGLVLDPLTLPQGNLNRARAGRYFIKGPCHRETCIEPRQGPATGKPESSPGIGDTNYLRNIPEGSNIQLYRNNNNIMMSDHKSMQKVGLKQYLLSLGNSTEKRAAFREGIRDPKRVAERKGDPSNSEGQGNKCLPANRETSKDLGTSHGQVGQKSRAKNSGVPCDKMLWSGLQDA